MPSRTKNGTIVEVTDLPVTSQLNGWLEGRQTSFFFSIVEQNCWKILQCGLDKLNSKAVTDEHNVVSL